MSGWLREAYFAELLAREERALRVFDRFAEVERRTRCATASRMEYAEHGDLGAWLEQKGAQSERFVRREIAALLRALDALHRGHALHRDLTPFNVFVCEGEKLKLGDFGIATHQLSRRGVTADAFNLFHVPNEIAWGRVRRWQKRDDVYQIGLIAAMLLRGDITSRCAARTCARLPCSDHLKEVIHRCLGSRGKRYEAASELIAALRQRPKEPRLGRVMQSRRESASRSPDSSCARAPKRSPPRKRPARSCSRSPAQATDVLVRGRPNALQIAGKDGGSKLIEVRRLAVEGTQGDGDRRAAVLEARLAAQAPALRELQLLRHATAKTTTTQRRGRRGSQGTAHQPGLGPQRADFLWERPLRMLRAASRAAVTKKRSGSLRAEP